MKDFFVGEVFLQQLTRYFCVILRAFHTQAYRNLCFRILFQVFFYSQNSISGDRDRGIKLKKIRDRDRDRGIILN